MFRCEFSKEMSDPAIFKFDTVPDTDSAPTGDAEGIRKNVRQLVKAAEKPVTLVVRTRSKEYVNYDEEGYAYGSSGYEIVKEIRIRAKHLEAAKLHYGV